MRRRLIFHSVRPYIAAIAVLLLAGLLVVAIYYTQFNLPWIAFLTGVLAAAVLGMVSRASRAEWIITRREAKISLLQEKLAAEVRRCRDLEQKLANIVPAAPLPVVEIPFPEPNQHVQSLSEHASEQRDAALRILAAIEHDEFQLFCQRITPISGDLARQNHYEILIRLIEEEEGLMPPGAFFPAVEKHGLMPHLDRWVVEHLVEWIADNRGAVMTPAGSVFFVNLAPATMHDPEFPGFVYQQLKLHSVLPHSLCFEITDSEVVKYHQETIAFVQQAKKIDCCVALCNVGRDSTAFDLLRPHGLDFIKIDGNLVLDTMRNASSLNQVASIVHAARASKSKTIAEYVESEACVLKLQGAGVDFAQGFGIAKPQPLAEII